MMPNLLNTYRMPLFKAAASACWRIFCTVAIIACAELGEEASWKNPFDSKGENYYPPQLKTIPDTIVGQHDTLTVHLSGTDKNNGEIIRYYWSLSGPIFDSSSAAPRNIDIVNKGGGYINFYYGAKDNDGLVVIKQSTFLFNRPIKNCSVEKPVKDKVAPWISKNKKLGEGKVEFRFQAEDPDGKRDTLSYQLFLGTHKDTLLSYFKGYSKLFIPYDKSKLLLPNTQYYFKLHVQSASKDTCTDNGMFITSDTIP